MPLQDLRDEPRSSNAPVPDAETCAQMFRAFKNTTESDPKNKLTADEEKKFEESFKDEKFREILADYMDEISDPAHRAETEAYITQLEGDAQVRSQFLLTHETYLTSNPNALLSALANFSEFMLLYYFRANCSNEHYL